MSALLRGLRVVLLALALIAAWPVLAALVAGEITFDQGVDLLVTTRSMSLVLVVVVIGVAISFARSALVRTLAAVAVCACVLAVATGAASPASLRAGAASATEGARVAAACGWTTTTTRTGEGVRTVLKDPQASGAVVGYVLTAGGDAIARGLDGQPMTQRCSS